MLDDSERRFYRTAADIDACYGSADLFDSVVIDDIAVDVVEESSQNGPMTMKRQIGFAETEVGQETRDQASTLSRRDGKGRPVVAAGVGH